MLSKTVEGYHYEEFIYCGCGCGLTRSKYDIRGRERKYINYHQKGIKHNLKQNKENNPNWKDNNVGYFGLHKWIKNYFPKPNLCMLCKIRPAKDLACITGIYNRELRNWAWFCHSCHMKWDNIEERGWIKRRANLV